MTREREPSDDALPGRLLATGARAGSPAEARAAELLARMSPPRELHPAQVARIQARLAGGWAEPRRSFRRPVLAFGALGLVAFVAAGAVAGRHLVSGGSWRGPEIVALPSARPAARPHTTAVSAPPAEAPPLETPAPVRHRARPPRGLAEESRVVGAALELLHRSHDARGALARLDEHDARFPHGQLQREATMARIEALLMTSRSREALRVLDALPVGRTPRDAEILAVRGELRAEAGRCPEAERDFGGALARTARGPSAERALFGRATCRSRRGDAAGARADLAAYLAAFPSGRFAAKAHAGLGAPPPVAPSMD